MMATPGRQPAAIYVERLMAIELPDRRRGRDRVDLEGRSGFVTRWVFVGQVGVEPGQRGSRMLADDIAFSGCVHGP